MGQHNAPCSMLHSISYCNNVALSAASAAHSLATENPIEFIASCCLDPRPSWHNREGLEKKNKVLTIKMTFAKPIAALPFEWGNWANVATVKKNENFTWALPKNKCSHMHITSAFNMYLSFDWLSRLIDWTIYQAQTKSQDPGNTLRRGFDKFQSWLVEYSVIYKVIYYEQYFKYRRNMFSRISSCRCCKFSDKVMLCRV